MDLIGQFFTVLESYSWIGVSTNFVHMNAIDAQIQPVADSLGMQLPLIKYTLSLFLAFPFAAILRAMPNANMKHFFSMVGGLFIIQWVFGPDWIHSFISSAVTYLICAIVPRKYSVIIGFTWVMTYMTVAHGYRMWVSYMSGVFDFTGTQMVLTMKLTSFVYNLYDGTFDKENVFKSYADDKRKARVYSDRKRFAVTSLPNPLEFFGYIYCFTCLLAGPAFEYQDYVQSVDGTKFKRSDGKKGDVPGSILPALWRLVVGVVAMALHLYLSGLFPLSNIYNSNFIAMHNPVYRFGYTYLALTGYRFMYYFAWKVAEGASIMAGFGFEGFDKEGRALGWRGVENIDIISFESAPNVQILSRSWNKRTQGWLERYTYHRSGGSLVATYFISALWHGLYPGFFLFFMQIPVLTQIERLVKAKVNPYIIPGYDGFNDATAPAGVVTFAYWQVFSLSSLERSLAALGSYYYVPQLVFALIYLGLSAAPTPRKKERKE